jgi:hypothetical protein
VSCSLSKSQCCRGIRGGRPNFVGGEIGLPVLSVPFEKEKPRFFGPQYPKLIRSTLSF